MGCQSSVVLGNNLTFSICTHDPDTGILTDADSDPTYRVYEDETAAAILTGTMAVLDTGNTTGFYTEQIACTTANGFESRKSYTIYIEATVGGDKGGIAFGFTVGLPSGIVKNTELANFEFLMVLSSDHITPATGKTITATRSIDGAAFASCANAVAEVASGVYKITLAAADLNGDVITLKFSETDCDDRYITLITES